MRFNLRASLRLAVFPFRLLHLNVGAVSEHDTAQIRRGLRGKNLPPKAPCRQSGNHAGMVDMRMGQQHIINQRFLNRQLAVLEYIQPLLHAVIHQNVFPARIQIMTAPRHLMGCSYKNKLHSQPLLHFLCSMRSSISPPWRRLRKPPALFRSMIQGSTMTPAEIT